MKKNNKGFTLVELLAVIVLLGVVMTIGTTSIIGARRKINEKMVNTKLGEIVTAAKEYGQDNKSSVIAGTINYVYVKDLLATGYLETEEKDSSGGDAILNNVTGNKMNNDYAKVKIKMCGDSLLSSKNRVCACIENSNYQHFGDTNINNYRTDEYDC